MIPREDRRAADGPCMFAIANVVCVEVRLPQPLPKRCSALAVCCREDVFMQHARHLPCDLTPAVPIQHSENSADARACPLHHRGHLQIGEVEAYQQRAARDSRHGGRTGVMSLPLQSPRDPCAPALTQAQMRSAPPAAAPPHAPLYSLLLCSLHTPSKLPASKLRQTSEHDYLHRGFLPLNSIVKVTGTRDHFAVVVFVKKLDQCRPDWTATADTTARKTQIFCGGGT